MARSRVFVPNWYSWTKDIERPWRDIFSSHLYDGKYLDGHKERISDQRVRKNFKKKYNRSYRYAMKKELNQLLNQE